MNKRMRIAIAAALIMSGMAQAESYFVRNRPFTQVMQVSGEALVGTEAFLRALGLNWSLDGSVVTLSDRPAANPALTPGTYTFRYGKMETALELSPRGGSVYASLRPLAKLAGFAVSVNRSSGTVDVARARFSTESEKKLLGEVEQARESEAKAVAEAWDKKAEELRKKRSGDGAAAEATPENGGGDVVEEKPSGAAEKPTTKGKGKESSPAAAAEPEKSDNEKAVDEVNERLKKLETPPPKVAHLEVASQDATPDPATGTVVIRCVVKNLGDGDARPASGTLVLRGPDASGNATDVLAAGKSAPAQKTRVFLRKSLSGPALKPGQQWEITEKYSYPSGNSLPIGTFSAEFTLSNTK